MKARVKATGEIVEATYWRASANGIKYYDIDNSGNTMAEEELDFDVPYIPDYWTRLEHQAAIATMGGICGNASYSESSWEDMAEDAIRAAHALIQKLKEKEADR